MQDDLLGYVTAQVAAYQGSTTQLARAAGVQPSWLRMFAKGAIPNPGVKQMQLLAAHFRDPKAAPATDPAQAVA